MTTLARFLAFPIHVQSWNRPAGSVHYRVTNPFGGVDLVNAGQVHQGVDVGNTREGDPVYAPVSCTAEGVIHTDGAVGLLFTLGGGWQLELWHLSRTLIGKPQAVEQGQKIGYTGASGKVSGAHTHIELKLNGKVRDPLPFLPLVEREQLSIPGATAGSRYIDVPETSRFHDAIKWATDRNYIPNASGARFNPRDPITREQLAVILRRLYADLD